MELAERWKKQCSEGDQRNHSWPGVNRRFPAGAWCWRRGGPASCFWSSWPSRSIPLALRHALRACGTTRGPARIGHAGGDGSRSAATLRARTPRPVRRERREVAEAHPSPAQAAASLAARSRPPQQKLIEGTGRPDRGHQRLIETLSVRHAPSAGLGRDQARNCSRCHWLITGAAAVESGGGRARGDRDLFPSIRNRLPAVMQSREVALMWLGLIVVRWLLLWRLTTA